MAKVELRLKWIQKIQHKTADLQKLKEDAQQTITKLKSNQKVEEISDYKPIRKPISEKRKKMWLQEKCQERDTISV